MAANFTRIHHGYFTGTSRSHAIATLPMERRSMIWAMLFKWHKEIQNKPKTKPPPPHTHTKKIQTNKQPIHPPKIQTKVFLTKGRWYGKRFHGMTSPWINNMEYLSALAHDKHIVKHDLTLLILETEYSGCGDQYHACWWPIHNDGLFGNDFHEWRSHEVHTGGHTMLIEFWIAL